MSFIAVDLSVYRNVKIKDKLENYLFRSFFFFFFSLFHLARLWLGHLPTQKKTKKIIASLKIRSCFQIYRWNLTKMLSTSTSYVTNSTEEAKPHRRFGVSRSRWLVLGLPTKHISACKFSRSWVNLLTISPSWTRN